MTGTHQQDDLYGAPGVSDSPKEAKPRIHTPSAAVIIEVAPTFGQKAPHYEIEWRGSEGRSRSGNWYYSRQGAESLAIECGARDVSFEVEGVARG